MGGTKVNAAMITAINYLRSNLDVRLVLPPTKNGISALQSVAGTHEKHADPAFREIILNPTRVTPGVRPNPDSHTTHNTKPGEGPVKYTNPPTSLPATLPLPDFINVDLNVSKYKGSVVFSGIAPDRSTLLSNRKYVRLRDLEGALEILVLTKDRGLVVGRVFMEIVGKD